MQNAEYNTCIRLTAATKDYFINAGDFIQLAMFFNVD